MIDPLTNNLINAYFKLRSGWCQFHLAEASNGDNVMPYSKRAVCWCIEGAVKAVCDFDADKVLKEIHDAIVELEYKNTINIVYRDAIKINAWNDNLSRNQKEVLDLLESILKQYKVSIVDNTIFFDDVIQNIKETIYG